MKLAHCIAVGFLSISPLLIAAGKPAPARVTVQMQNMQFTPETVTIKPGDTIVWTNNDDRDHAVASADHTFDSANLSAGQTFEHVFNAAGSFAYTCKYHPRMKGTVVVK